VKKWHQQQQQAAASGGIVINKTGECLHQRSEGDIRHRYQSIINNNNNGACTLALLFTPAYLTAASRASLRASFRIIIYLALKKKNIVASAKRRKRNASASASDNR